MVKFVNAIPQEKAVFVGQNIGGTGGGGELLDTNELLEQFTAFCYPAIAYARHLGIKL